MKAVKNTNGTAIAMQVSIISIIVNLILSAFKLLAGILADSGAMISDAIHSASDVFSTIIVIIGIKIANRQSDADHPYGHERLECVASIILSVVLMLTGIGIGLDGLRKIVGGDHDALAVPGRLALAAAVISIITKECLYHYTRRTAKRICSSALLADAWHHRSDALSSIGAFAGILGARLGFPVTDSIACVVICLFIIKASIDIFKDAMDKMIDKSCDSQTVQAMLDIVTKDPGVAHVDNIRTRIFASRVYVDIEIAVKADLPLRDAHCIAENVHDSIEKNFPQVKHCMVHVNPAEEM